LDVRITALEAKIQINSVVKLNDERIGKELMVPAARCPRSNAILTTVDGDIHWFCSGCHAMFEQIESIGGGEVNE